MIEFYFDPISPYAWLASTKLDELQKQTGKKVVVRPVLFAGLLKAHDTKGPAEVDAKRQYTFRDVMRIANHFKLDMLGPPNHPFNPLLALRNCIAIEDDGLRLEFSTELMRAAWEHGLDISNADVVNEVLEHCNIDKQQAHERVTSPEVKSALIAATEQAVELGIFGVPTFRVDKEIFWGVDRIDSLRQYIEGNRIDETRLETVLAREPAAVRRR